MPSKKIRTPIEPGSTYHIFNRGNNHQDVFFKEEDYIMFLKSLKQYLLEYCSYKTYLSSYPTDLSKEEVLYWFGSRDEFIAYHEYLQDINSLNNLTLEE